MRTVRKAVIPAAGLGTRVLPASKSIPKEMLPIVDKPGIQYIIEEIVNAGIEEILIVTSRGKSAIEDFFDRSPELENRLQQSGKYESYNKMLDISKLADIQYIRQKEPLGLGHAVLCAKNFVGNEPFAVLYGDDVITDKNSVIKELCEAHKQYNLGVLGIKKVPLEKLNRYSSLKVEPIKNNYMLVSDMIEKPKKGDEYSNYSIMGRCVLPAQIFDLLMEIPRGVGGEYQLTDAMRILARTIGMIGVDYKQTRYDMGDKLNYVQAIVETAMNHEEIGADFNEYLKKITHLF